MSWESNLFRKEYQSSLLKAMIVIKICLKIRYSKSSHKKTINQSRVLKLSNKNKFYILKWLNKYLKKAHKLFKKNYRRKRRKYNKWKINKAAQNKLKYPKLKKKNKK